MPFKLALVIILACLQTQSARVFMQAALQLDDTVQKEILGFIQEPMTQMAAEQPLTRDGLLCILGLRDDPETPCDEVASDSQNVGSDDHLRSFICFQNVRR